MTQNNENGISKKREETCRRILVAIRESKGLLALAAKRAGIGYSTLWRYTQEFPTIKAAVQEAKEELLDFAESKLMENIQNGDTASILFFLKCKGKGRGYIERLQSDVTMDVTTKGEKINGQQPVPVSVIDQAMEILYATGGSTPSPDNGSPTPG